MSIWLSLALLFAVLEAIAVSKNIRQLEYIAKPAVMICLFLWLYASTGLQGQAFWFGLGILLSLIGDVLLMFSLDRLFLFGLVAFLFTHIFYLAGLREELINITARPLTLGILIAFIAISLLNPPPCRLSLTNAASRHQFRSRRVAGE